MSKALKATVSVQGTDVNTSEFLGIWESLDNPGFKPIEFDGFRKSAGLRLNRIAIRQMQVLTSAQVIGILKE
jgi:hypothetical protein